MIEQLLKEAKNLEFIGPYAGPKKPILSTDTVIGEVPDNLKRLYLLTRKYAGKIKNILRTQEPTDENHEKVHRLEAIVSTLTSIFWISINEEFSQYHTWDCNISLSLREGWKIVIIKEDDEEAEDGHPEGRLDELLQIFRDFADHLSEEIDKHSKLHRDDDNDLNDAIDEFVKRS